MKIELEPEFHESAGRVFINVDIYSKSGKHVFSTDQESTGFSLASVVAQYFAEIDFPEFRDKIGCYFGIDYEFNRDSDFEISRNGKPISDAERDKFLIYIVDACEFCG